MIYTILKKLTPNPMYIVCKSVIYVIQIPSQIIMFIFNVPRSLEFFAVPKLTSCVKSY